MYKLASLPFEIRRIVSDKATEYPFTGQYENTDQEGTYLCKLCGFALYRASSKFHSGCGWPSFDTEIEGHVKREADADGKRIEILCQRCGAHLGHVFHGEGFTPLNTRHCVNSASLDFVPGNIEVLDSEEGIFAGGCFWGMEYLFQKKPGVLKVESGYLSGFTDHPTYHEVCAGTTGHIEAVRVLYDPEQISYEEIAKFFFEIHDPTQHGGQGPDLGEQYISIGFYYDQAQQDTLISLIHQLEIKGYDIATEVRPVDIFWVAEDYHQDYYIKTGKLPYCHSYVKRF